MTTTLMDKMQKWILNTLRWARRNTGNLINIAMLLTTFSLYKEAVRQNKAAEDSAKAAIRAVSLSANQFEIQNTPYLIISKVDSINFAPNEPLFMRWQFTNLGGGLARIDSMRGVFSHDLKGKSLNTIPEVEKLLFNSFEWSKVETYVSIDHPATSNLKFRERISTDGYAYVKNRFSDFNVGIEIYYNSLANGKRRSCEIILRLFGGELGGIEIKRIVNRRLE